MPPIKKILVFGNPLIRNDSLPPRLVEDLSKEFNQIKFEEFDAVEDLEKEGNNIYILDSVEGIKEVGVITDIDILLTDKIYSVHDFDLAYTLKLMKKTNKVEKVVIIGVPIGIKKDIALDQLKVAINTILSSENG